jgi:hypothetical protein
MSKRQRDERDGRKRLERAGWKVRKASRYNSGSELVLHSTVKTLAGHYLTHELGYSVSFECEKDETGEAIDVLAWGKPDRISPLAVEIETNLTQETVEHKIGQYVDSEPIQEVYFLDPLDAPAEIMQAYEWVSKNL